MGFSVSLQSLFYTEDLDYQHIVLIVVIWSLIVFDEHKVNVRFRCTHSRLWRKNVDCRCKTVAVTPSGMTCHCKEYRKTNYPGRYIFLRRWRTFGCHCEWPLMVTLSWWVVIHHTIFQMIPGCFWCIANEVKYGWFDIFTYRP